MKKMIWLCLCACLCLGSLSAGKSADKRDLVRHTLAWDGLERSYYLREPQGLDKARKLPLVLALHGGGGVGEKMNKLTGLSDLGEKEGFLAVFPEGVGRNWNDGRPGDFSKAHRDHIDDVGFINALVEKLKTEYPVDPRRVYACGISNGAMMCFRLACEMAGTFAAVAAVGGSMPENLPGLCHPEKPVAVMVIFGRQDPLVPYGGGYVSVLGRKRGKVVPVEESLEFWARVNHCDLPEEAEALPDLDSKDGTRVFKRSCGKVEILLVEGGGHTWPGGWQYLWEFLVGKTSRDFNASETIWKFFQRNHR